jgi:hypothetical protein
MAPVLELIRILPGPQTTAATIMAGPMDLKNSTTLFMLKQDL